jgi:hypothetical protein
MNCKIGINWNWRLQNVFIDLRITQKKQKLTKVAKLLKSEFYSFQHQSQDKKFKLQIKKENLLMYNSTSS